MYFLPFWNKDCINRLPLDILIIFFKALSVCCLTASICWRSFSQTDVSFAASYRWLWGMMHSVNLKASLHKLCSILLLMWFRSTVQCNFCHKTVNWWRFHGNFAMTPMWYLLQFSPNHHQVASDPIFKQGQTWPSYLTFLHQISNMSETSVLSWRHISLKFLAVYSCDFHCNLESNKKLLRKVEQ